MITAYFILAMILKIAALVGTIMVWSYVLQDRSEGKQRKNNKK